MPIFIYHIKTGEQKVLTMPGLAIPLFVNFG